MDHDHDHSAREQPVKPVQPRGAASERAREHGRGASGSHGGDHAGHAQHHAMMVMDFRRRFWISLLLTAPVLVLAPMIQELFGLLNARLLRFRRRTPSAAPSSGLQTLT